MKKTVQNRMNELSFLLYWNLRRCRKQLEDLREDEEGIGTIELVLILVVLIGLVVIFKSQLNNLINSIFSKINDAAGGI